MEEWNNFVSFLHQVSCFGASGSVSPSEMFHSMNNILFQKHQTHITAVDVCIQLYSVLSRFRNVDGTVSVALIHGTKLDRFLKQME